MTTLIAFAVGGALTWVLRAAFIVVLPTGQVPHLVLRLLRYAAPAAFAALIGSTAQSLSQHGDLRGWRVAAVLAVTVAAAWRLPHVLSTLAVASVAATLITHL